MGCKLFVFLLALFAVVFSLSCVFAEDTPITGLMLSTSMDMAIKVVVAPPAITINIPRENNTYLREIALPLNYSESSATLVWYNIDDGENFTLPLGSTTIYFNATEGEHTLNLFANNGVTSQTNVTFYVNATRFSVIYDEYKLLHKGDSTDFMGYSIEDLKSLSNIAVENNLYGKIVFPGAIDVTADETPTNNNTNLDVNTNISYNYIWLNSTALPNFNTEATLYLYNLSFINPRILRDGALCPSSVCTLESYTFYGSSGTLKFNVTGFSAYSAEETPGGNGTTIITPSTGGGGGGGGTKVVYVEKNVSLETPLDVIRVSLAPGESLTKSLNIINPLETDSQIYIDVTKYSEFIKVKDSSFLLRGGESKTIDIDFQVSSDTPATIYLGKILVRSASGDREILVIIEVNQPSKTGESLLSITLKPHKDIPVYYRGQNIIADVKLMDVLVQNGINSTIKYLILNDNGDVVYSFEETVEFEKQTAFVRTFNVPSEMALGRYVIYARASYGEETTSDSFAFLVEEKQGYVNGLIIVLLLVIAFLMLLIYLRLLILERRAFAEKRTRRKEKQSAETMYNRIYRNTG